MSHVSSLLNNISTMSNVTDVCNIHKLIRKMPFGLRARNDKREENLDIYIFGIPPARL